MNQVCFISLSIVKQFLLHRIPKSTKLLIQPMTKQAYKIDSEKIKLSRSNFEIIVNIILHNFTKSVSAHPIRLLN